MTTIKFGTSGWRGLIARDFTFENVRLATQGIAEYLKGPEGGAPSHPSKTVIVGYDTRFLGREFALAAVEVLAANGVEVLTDGAPKDDAAIDRLMQSAGHA